MLIRRTKVFVHKNRPSIWHEQGCITKYYSEFADIVSHRQNNIDGQLNAGLILQIKESRWQINERGHLIKGKA